MKWLRVVERGNRQILLTAEKHVDGDGYSVVIETHYQGDQFVSVAVGGYDTRQAAYDGMMSSSDDMVMSHIMSMIDHLDEQ
jgi:hypothetical protein